MSPKDRADFALRLLGLILSWPVITALILIVFQSLLRAQLPRLFDRLKSVGKGGLELYEPRTTATSLGDTRVSNIPAPFPVDHFTYHSHGYQCEISYPREDGWQVAFDLDETTQIGAQAKALGQVAIFVIVATQPLHFPDGSAFLVNVNVLIDPLEEPMGNHPISAYMGTSLDSAMRNIQRFSLKARDVDENTNSATFNYTGIMGGHYLSFFQRVTIARGLAHNVTMTIPMEGPLPDSLKTTLNAILNSFHVLDAPSPKAAEAAAS